MKMLQIFLLFVILTVSCLAQVPQLISPPNNSTMQKTTLDLRWEDVPGVSVYWIQYSPDSILTDSLSIAGNSLNIGPLNNDHIYYWRVRTNQPNSQWSPVWNFKTTELPVTPIVFEPENGLINRETTVVFKWNSNSVNKLYLLQLSKDVEFLGLDVVSYTATDTLREVTNLSNNSVYYWRVKAYNVDNIESNWSEVRSFKTRLATPALVGPLNNTRNQDTTVTFNWGIVESANKYNFQLSMDSLFSIDSLVVNFDTISNQIFIDSLQYNTTYYWRIIASNITGDSSKWSAIRNFTTRLIKPELLFPIDSVRNSDTSLVFRWNKVPGANKYTFQLATDSIFSSLIESLITDSTKYAVDSLKYNQRYYWRVRALNESGDLSNMQASTFKTILKEPVLISPKNKSKLIPVDTEFMWTTPSGADSFRIQLSYDSLFTKIFSDTLAADSLFTPDSLLFDTTYYWRTYAFNPEGDSSKWSGKFSFKTVAAIFFSPDSLADTINLSVKHIDTLTTISITNFGKNPYIIDSIKIKPDSVFSIDKNSAVLSAGEKETFKVRFKPGIADTGLTRGTVYFIRKNPPLGKLSQNDTLIVKLNLRILKAIATFSDSSLAYDSIDATTKSLKQIMIRNYGGNIPLKVDSISIMGADTAAFKLTQKPKQIKSNDSVAFFIEFKPQRLGLHTATLYIETNSYPDTILIFQITGYGRGGELSTTTLARITQLSDSVFEALTENDKPIIFKNNGNSQLNVSVKFAQNKFKVENDFQQNFVVKRGDSVSIKVKYMIPDFKETNKDTMRIIHNGFGEDTLFVYLEGTFDSLASAKKMQADLRLNGNQFSESDKVINENTPLTFTLNPELINSYPHLSFRIKYYTGGSGNRLLAENDGGFNFTIPRELAGNRGLLLSGQLIARDKNNKIIDSVTIFTPVNAQVVLPNYKTIDIGVPKSTAAEKKEDANVKWIMFGFPFEEVVADTLFSALGGIKNMKDGEWVMYQYNFAAADSFSLFSGYSLQPNMAYFAAQSLMDTFKISYRYKENLRTRKLTDSVLTTPGTNWKTISSPFLFDVEVEPSVILRRYDTNNKVYKMTNIMKPGEGYFVEPSVSRINLNTFGEYNPLIYPKILADIGWHINITASDKALSKENLVSLKTGDKLSKIKDALPRDYAASPRLQKGLNIYTLNESNEKSEVSIKDCIEGAVFNVVVNNDLQDDYINLAASVAGNIPQNFSYKVFDDNIKGTVENSLNNYFIKKDKDYTFKIVLGTDSYIKKTLKELSNQVPKEFSLSQNYPNPFNPITTINYQVPVNGFVSLKIYDILGSEVTTLVNEEKEAGYYKIDFNGNGMASGVYFFRINAGSFVDVKKMILLK